MTEALARVEPARVDPALSRTAWAVLTGLLAHGALLAMALQQEPAALPLIAETEVELLAPRAPEPRPEPPVEVKAEPPAPAAQPRAERRAAPAHARAAAPQPAMAAPLRTLADDVKTAEEPVRFVTDPNGSAFGYGTVQRGGMAIAGQVGPLQSDQVAELEGPRQGPAPKLSRPPMLGESEPCRGFFPARAQVDRGEVALKVRIEADGRVRSVAVSRESPGGQGFGFAARDCLLSKRFSPALDLAGEPVSVLSPVTVRFSR